MQLFGKKHVTLDDCFDDALLYEDNCNFGGAADVRETGSDSSSHTSRHINSEAIADLVLKKMRQEQRYPSNRGYPRAYVCGICSGNHPTGLCQREGNAHASGMVWCDTCRKYGTHPPESCYYRTRAANKQAQPRNDQREFQNRENPRVGGTGERPVPVLGAQPPLPGAAAVRYVDVATNDINQHQDLVPVGSYYEEEYDPRGHYSEEIYDDPRDLMFIGHGPSRGPPMGRGRQSTPPGSGACFKCGSTDHWARDCPSDKPSLNWPRVERFCPGCHLEHLSKNCPDKPKPPPNATGPTTSSLHLVDIIPSPPTSGSDEVVSLRAVTRAQAREGVPLEQESAKTASKKKRRRQRRKKNNSRATSSDAPGSQSARGKEKVQESASSSDKGGSVTIDRIDDPLQAVKTAMENRVAMKEKLPKELAEYPCAVEE